MFSLDKHQSLEKSICRNYRTFSAFQFLNGYDSPAINCRGGQILIM